MPNEALTVPRQPVVSESLQTIGYDAERAILAIQFNSGTVFHYYGVDGETYEAFLSAESKGKFYAARIRQKFRGAPMTGKCPGCGLLGLIGEPCESCIENERPAAIVREIDRQHKP